MWVGVQASSGMIHVSACRMQTSVSERVCVYARVSSDQFVCVHAVIIACVRASVHACMRACVRACVCACVFVCVGRHQRVSVSASINVGVCSHHCVPV